MNKLIKQLSKVSTSTFIPPKEGSWVEFYSANPMTMSKRTDFTVDNNKNGVLFVSGDKINWHNFFDSETVAQIGSDGKYHIYVCGRNNKNISPSATPDLDPCFPFSVGTDIYCTGNIECLYDYIKIDSGERPTGYTLSRLFADCGFMSYPELPQLDIYPAGFFSYMFYNNSTITTTPALTATTLPEQCYMGMFSECGQLKTIGKISATKFAGSAFDSMFSHSGITTLSNYTGYLGKGTFYDCTSLTSVDLSTYQHGTIESACFGQCTNLTTVILPDKFINICSGAFSNTSIITNATSNVVLSTKSGTYKYLFYVPTTATSLTISNDIDYLCQAGDFNTGITELSIPATVKKVCSGALNYATVRFAHARNVDLNIYDETGINITYSLNTKIGTKKGAVSLAYYTDNFSIANAFGSTTINYTTFVIKTIDGANTWTSLADATATLSGTSLTISSTANAVSYEIDLATIYSSTYIISPLGAGTTSNLAIGTYDLTQYISLMNFYGLKITGTTYTISCYVKAKADSSNGYYVDSGILPLNVSAEISLGYGGYSVIYYANKSRYGILAGTFTYTA